MIIKATKIKYGNLFMSGNVPIIGFRKYVLDFGRGPLVLEFHFFLWNVTIWKWIKKNDTR